MIKFRGIIQLWIFVITMIGMGGIVGAAIVYVLVHYYHPCPCEAEVEQLQADTAMYRAKIRKIHSSYEQCYKWKNYDPDLFKPIY